MKRKKVTVILISLVVLVVSYWGYKHIQNNASLLGRVHIDADAVLKIGIHEIKETLILDAITAPKYYYDQIQFSSSEEENDSIGGKGVDLQPYNLLLYTLPSVRQTVFGTLDIDNSEDFEQFVLRELKARGNTAKKKDNYHYAVLNKEKMAIAWNTEQVVYAFSTTLSIAKLYPVFSDILEQNKTISDKGHPLIAAVDDSDGHAVFVSNQSKVAVYFQDGQANIKGQTRTKKPQQFPKELSVILEQEAAFQLYFDANFEEKSNKNSVISTLEAFSFFI